MGKGDDFRPDKVKGVVIASGENQLVVYLDHNYPDAYKVGRLGRFVHFASMRLPVVVMCGGSVKVCATGREVKAMAAKLTKAISGQ